MPKEEERFCASFLKCSKQENKMVPFSTLKSKEKDFWMYWLTEGSSDVMNSKSRFFCFKFLTEKIYPYELQPRLFGCCGNTASI